MSDLRLISIVAIVALGAVTWAAMRVILAPILKPMRADTERRTEQLRRTGDVLAVWQYMADEHGYDAHTDRCACGDLYLTCPARKALHDYAMHLLGKSPVSSATPDVIVSGGTAYIAP